MPTVTWMNAGACLLFAFLAGVGWALGARIVGKLL